MKKIEKPKSLDEQAYSHIKDAILKCSLPPGEFLAEVHLAKELGISKTPIRKALARLQQEGFVNNIPYKGYFCTEILPKDIIEIYELRQLLEGYLIRQTTPLFTSAELDEIEIVICDAQKAIEARQFECYILLNRKFHHAFDRKYEHRRISVMLTNLDEHLQRILFYTHHKYNDLLHDDEHLLILEAVRAKDVELAEERMKDHLAKFCDGLISRINQA